MSETSDSDTTPLLPPPSHSTSIPESPIVLEPKKSNDSKSSKLNQPHQPLLSLMSQQQQQKQQQQQQKFLPAQTMKLNSKIAQSNKIGLQRTSRTTLKMKLLPEDPDLTSINNKRVSAGANGIDGGAGKNNDGSNDDDDDDDDEDEAYGTRPTRVYSQAKMITDTSARKDAETLGKVHRDLLPRVTAYCTCASYRMKELLRWLKDRKRIHNTSPKLFDECLYTPFTYKDWRGDSSHNDDENGHKLIRLADEGGEIDIGKKSDLFIFEYGVVIMWGYTQKEEAAFLDDLARFELEKLSAEDIQIEEFNYYITKSYQPRIYNDFITLRDDDNYMLKLSISHALAQSVKISLFEELVDNTIEDTQDIPLQIARTGKVEMNRDEIMKSIGELFILRININLHGSVLDSPELMWAEPQLEPIYQATRGYLEINQRVELLNQRLEVISDLLQMLKEQLGHSHEESLEFIVVLLVGVEVLVSIVNIIIDLFKFQ
ncbi:sporulation protein RMD1 [Lodderomyces elongisporus NRRL YB-4239]|uniref:Sporulation protein RMD1 n=1 Tax=Lodderomyces elongisporus (strain ATCC 11503 / CBS 2605 / JCM 1781 / NBRC 1676 / NRRL YB-4239) TaxID=379508 RepID=A5DXJ4_LODEL|nr:sporulation protein RMD1 [Lodderomyces elongisporus NRRL YB-4239]